MSMPMFVSLFTLGIALNFPLMTITIGGEVFQSWQSLLFDPWLDLGIILLVSMVAMSDFYRRFQSSIRNAPRLAPLEAAPTELPKISVVIPAYNEAVNIEACIAAVLANELPTDSQLQLIVADDASTDETLALAKSATDEDDRAVVFTVPPRPEGETWRGKNWACHCALNNAAEKATGEYVLFIDADVRLGEQAIARSLCEAETYQSDLLSCAPAIVCGCFSEWLVQPLMANLIAVGFDFEGVNDAQQVDIAIAAGPFMLFRRSAYDKIGGHGAVADNPVEDLALAALIKSSGLSLRYVLGLETATVRMYRSFGDLWEGWTKNYHLGGGRNILLTLVSASAVLLIFSMPWVGLAASIAGTVSVALKGSLAVGLMMLSAVAVSLQTALRQESAKVIGQPLRYVWLGWLGGLLVSAIALTSIVKTETGWGWTWRGRSLAKE